MDPILKEHQVRKIDNRQLLMPALTSFLIIFLIVVGVWFFRGGSFRLYASVFFSLYYITKEIWISVLLIGIIQNLVFLPLRFLGMRYSSSFDKFERDIEESSHQEAYLLFKNKVRKGDSTIIFYILNFVVNMIAFISAGRIFLIDFYNKPLDPNLIYKWVPYPTYPLSGDNFNFHFFKITETIAVSWKNIFLIWLSITIFFFVVKLLWRLLRIFLSRNKSLLKARINYNRFLVKSGGISGSILILSIIILRHIPIRVEGWLLPVDLTRQNTTMNTITAIGTFITTLHAGYTRHRINREIALKNGLESVAVQRVFYEKMRVSFRNAIFLGLGAFFITNQIPCAFELSVATFEILYILSPYTFDQILIRAATRRNKSELGKNYVTEASQ